MPPPGAALPDRAGIDYSFIERLARSCEQALLDFIDRRPPVAVVSPARCPVRLIPADTLPTTAAVLDLVARTDAIAVLPGRLSRPAAFGLVTRPAPVELPGAPIVVSWHRRYDSDPAHAWLRREVVAALRPDGVSGAGCSP